MPTQPEQDPLKQIMSTIINGFQQTTDAIQNLKQEQATLAKKQQQQAKAAYHGMTGSGKARYVTKLVEIEKQTEPRGAQARVAQIIEVSPSRITQLITSDKNRKNGK
ncbi:MAG: hypothetical protein ACJAVX_004206 [Pseudoalteromonas rhizosphaerae]|jgi:hypothetical protein|uniref:hypothetical protein n=1 Tax=Pseudoalteromonas rhizosphaerae TaxID=2518973 RepID=UPI0039E68BEF